MHISANLSYGGLNAATAKSNSGPWTLVAQGALPYGAGAGFNVRKGGGGGFFQVGPVIGLGGQVGANWTLMDWKVGLHIPRFIGFDFD